jgi:hypothetical protein
VHIRFARRRQTVVEQHQKRVAVHLAQDHPGRLVQPIMSSDEKYEVCDGCEGSDCACFDGQAYDLRESDVQYFEA